MAAPWIKGTVSRSINARKRCFLSPTGRSRIWEHTRPRATVGARIHARAAVLSEPISPRRVVGARLHEPGEHRQAPPLTPLGSPTVIRLTWRQFRTQAAVAIGGLVIVAIVELITGPQLVHRYDTTVATCEAQGDCQTATAVFLAKDNFPKNGLDALIFAVPTLIGIFWGAPLIARELPAARSASPGPTASRGRAGSRSSSASSACPASPSSGYSA